MKKNCISNTECKEFLFGNVMFLLCSCAAILGMAVVLCKQNVTCLLSSAMSQTRKKHTNKLIGRLANPFELLTLVISVSSAVSSGLLMPAASCTESDGQEQ